LPLSIEEPSMRVRALLLFVCLLATAASAAPPYQQPAGVADLNAPL